MRRLLLAVLLAVLGFAGQVLAQPLILTQTYQNPTPADNDIFGQAVAIAGSRALVGAPEDDADANNAGAAYLFDTTTGALLMTFLNPAPDPGDAFGFAVAMVGNNVLIAAPFEDAGGGTIVDAGAVYVFSGTTGLLLQTIVDPTPGADEQFGLALAAFGNNVLVGSPFDDTGAIDAGAVHLFDGTTGALLQTFANPAPDNGDEFGMAIAGAGTNVLVGAKSDDDDGTTNSGAAYLFDGSTGGLLFTLNNPSPLDSDLFGNAVAAAGNDLIVAARSHDEGGVLNTGAVYVFSGTTGAPLRTLLSPDAPAAAGGDQFGFSVAGVGSSGLVLIGAPTNDLSGFPDAGSTYLFNVATGALMQSIDNPAAGSGDNFGSSAASFDHQVLIGTPNDDIGGSNTGTAYLYSSPNLSPIANAGRDQTLECTSPTGTQATLDGSGSSDPDNDPLTYTWRENGNIIAGPSTSPTSIVTFNLGVHTIELTADDGKGETGTDVVLITIEDTTPPVISLNGENPDTLECRSPYVEAGAVVSDICDPSPALVITGTVDADVPGTYIITYTATDASQNSSSTTRTVEVIADNTPPVITLNGENPMALECHAGSYVEPGAVVSDNCDPSPRLVISGIVNTDLVGTYAINYTATDASGNDASVTRTVNVVDTTPPIITPKPPIVFTGNSHNYTTITLAQSVASVSDGCAGNIPIDQVVITKVTSDEPDNVYGGCDGFATSDIVILSDCKSVNVRKERKCDGNGRVYTIHWQVSDPSGNVGTAVSEVEIQMCGTYASDDDDDNSNVPCSAIDDGPVYTVNSNCVGAGKSNYTDVRDGDNETAETELPEGYAVFQNYPNPFNPTTEIGFELPEANHVVVRIFNTVGEAIRTLADREFSAGRHVVRWNAKNSQGERVPSGVYFYRVSSADFTVTKRMILAK